MNDGRFLELDEEWAISCVRTSCEHGRRRASRSKCRPEVREKLLLEFGGERIATGFFGLTHARIVGIVDGGVVAVVEIRVVVVAIIIALVEIVGTVRLPRP